MIMTCDAMKVKRYTDKVLVSCWRNDRDLVMNPTTLGFIPQSINAEKKESFNVLYLWKVTGEKSQRGKKSKQYRGANNVVHGFS